MQISDGAAAVLLMTRAEAAKRGLPILGIFRSFAAVGVDPAVMGIGPAVAIPAAVKMAGLAVDDIDLFELNEAFASQVGAHPPCRQPSSVHGWNELAAYGRCIGCRHAGPWLRPVACHCVSSRSPPCRPRDITQDRYLLLQLCSVFVVGIAPACS